jgi:hypothetical protein
MDDQFRKEIKETIEDFELYDLPPNTKLEVIDVSEEKIYYIAKIALFDHTNESVAYFTKSYRKRYIDWWKQTNDNQSW